VRRRQSQTSVTESSMHTLALVLLRQHQFGLSIADCDRATAKQGWKISRYFRKYQNIENIKSIMIFSETFSVKEWRDLENWIRNFSRLLKMAPFDRPCISFYWSAVVIIALSCRPYHFGGKTIAYIGRISQFLIRLALVRKN